MIKKKFKVTIVLMAIFLCWTVGQAVVIENHNGTSANKPKAVEFNLSNLPEPLFNAPLADSLIETWEDGTLPPWTTSSSGTAYLWGIRDTGDVYGPSIPAASGTYFAGMPVADVAEYTGQRNGRLVSPIINTTGWTNLYLAFNHWADFEGTATNFDGGIVEISKDSGVTWKQIDSLVLGHLNPTYDERFAGGSYLGVKWGYCYDTGTPIQWTAVKTGDLFALGYATAGNKVAIRFYFASDQLAGGNGWFVDDIKITSYPPPDLQPPVVEHTALPDTIDTLNTMTVKVRATDEGSGVDTDSVLLYYKIEDGAYVSLKMTSVGADTFSAIMPRQQWYTDVYYHFQAADLANPPNIVTTPEYSYEVTDARTIQYDDGQPYWVAGDLAPGNGLFNEFTWADVGFDSVMLHKVIMYFDGYGPFDLQVYAFQAAWPGAMLLSKPDTSPGYMIYTVDITDDSIRVQDPSCLVGWIEYVMGIDTARVMMDPTQEWPQIQWGWIGGAWQQTAYAGGDFMIRLKVLPLPRPIPGVQESPKPQEHLLFSLKQVAPNPMRTNTVIEYQVPKAQSVLLRIYDVSGKLVKTLVNGRKEAGIHQVTWNAQDEQGSAVANGIYFYQLQGEKQNLTRKLVVTR